MASLSERIVTLFIQHFTMDIERHWVSYAGGVGVGADQREPNEVAFFDFYPCHFGVPGGDA
ncbi:hypothetical protein D3C80_2067180 [compost metagenome]